MTPDELLAAADAVVQASQEYPGDEWYSQKTATAADKLARHVQRMYDPTPVDWKWWRSVARGKAIYHRQLALEYRKKSIEFLYGYNTIAVMKTRGDVRRLCEVMGIELREEGT